MAFEKGHKKVGGRRAGTPNRLTGTAREVARRLLADPEYQQSLAKRLRQGAAPRVELHPWQLAFGRPGVEPEETPEARGASADLGESLASSGSRRNRTPPRPGRRSKHRPGVTPRTRN
jgi:hypothetical protein